MHARRLGELAIVKGVRPCTMTSVERMAALINAVDYIVAKGLDGAMVECGVWRGGSMMTVARKLLPTGQPWRRCAPTCWEPVIPPNV